MSTDSNPPTTPATDTVLEHLRAERRAGRTVLTLVELSQATALDPGTAESVMDGLVADPERGVRRSTADPTRWHLRPPNAAGGAAASR